MGRTGWVRACAATAVALLLTARSRRSNAGQSTGVSIPSGGEIRGGVESATGPCPSGG
ncbi:MAG: hypothetical protein JWR55_1252 [Aeromicrobium sp.]|jgi:hypothetical protein|nr:hypothetical protein [Aeromicrobium sp.]